MKLTVDLDPDTYTEVVSFADVKDCSISAAVNQLLRRSLPGAHSQRGSPPYGMERRNGLLVCDGREVVAAETVQRIESEDNVHST